MRNVDRIAGIPTHIVHGRFDQVCPLTQASRLVAALAAAGAAPATYVHDHRRPQRHGARDRAGADRDHGWPAADPLTGSARVHCL